MGRLVCFALVVTVVPAWGRTIGSTHQKDMVVEIARHRARQTKRPAVDAARAAAVPAVLPDQGNIAVVDDTDGVVTSAGFDLNQRTIEFRPQGANATQYTYAAGSLRFDQEAPGRGTAVALQDDDSKPAPLPFSFPFYGQRYESVFIHSDGNVTFGQPEHSSDIRDFVRMVVGPPRIAAYFADLDPSQPDAAVTYLSDRTRFLITWNNVPFYAEAPGAAVPRQTFQLALFPDGRIEVHLRQIQVTQAAVGANSPLGVIGLAPGGATRIDQVTFVDYAGAAAGALSTAIVEEFSGTEEFDWIELGKKFYRNHDDAYDYLVIFNTGQREFSECADAIVLRNWARGIGLRAFGIAEEFDGSRDAGSAGRLQTVIYMGPLARYPDDPAANIAPGTPCGRNSSLSILGQESGHRFGAYTRFVDPETSRPSAEMLGRDNAHWSFYLNTDASYLEGNQIEDKGAGQSPRFETKEIVRRFSRLDLYLMGVAGPEEVPPTFLVRQPSIDFPRGRAPQSGLFFDGTKFEVNLPMIVAAEGRRLPDHTVSPRSFRFAFVLLAPAGSSPSAAEIAKLERIREAWERAFAQATEMRARAETRLVRGLSLSVWPAAGLIQGRTVQATVSLAAPAASPLTVRLAAAGGQVSVPASVTIPAGQRSAEFSISANSTGVTELVATGPDNNYDTGRAMLSVRSDLAGLRLEQLWTLALSFGLVLPAPAAQQIAPSNRAGSQVFEEILFAVRDENFLPYPGLRLNVSASGSGSTAPAAPLTDGEGRARLRWTLDRAPGNNTLTVSLDGQPDISARVTTAGAQFQPSRRREVRTPIEVRP